MANSSDSDRDILRRVFNTCNPFRPASREHYFDCSEVRGSSSLIYEVMRRLDRTDDFLSFLFTGHIGCGKSSELKQLSRELAVPREDAKCYLPVFIDMEDYLDIYDADTTELLLAVVSDTAAQLREKLGIELEDNYFEKRLGEIKGFLLSDLEIGEGELSLGTAKVKLKALKGDAVARKKVRAALAPKTSNMLQEVNTVFENARAALREKKGKEQTPFDDLVIIVDSLEKIRGFGGRKEGEESHRELFIDRYAQLTGMQAHFIYTVPLRLVRSLAGPELEQRYDGAPFVLPMVKVNQRGSHEPYEPGRQRLLDLLALRVEPEPLERVFDSESLAFLLEYSGGQSRSLLQLAQSACAYADRLPIQLQHVKGAVKQTVQLYSSAPEHHWAKLAALDASPDQTIPGGDKDYLAMLENLSVLEYINGGVQETFEAAEPWYAVNPIVRQLTKFKKARSQLSTPGSHE